MKNLKNLTISLLMVSLILCGCSSKKKVDYNLSLVAGNNSCSLVHDYRLAQEYLNKLFSQGGHLSIVKSDGSPCVVKSENIDPIKSYTTSTQKKAYLKENTSEIVDALNNVESKSPEIDLIETLNYASKSFNANNKSNNNIVCFISGLSTKGLLNMTTLGSLNNLDIDNTLKNLKAEHALPNLHNIDNIYLYSIGQLASYQKLSSSSIHKQKDFLKKLLSESGAKKIHFVDSNPISNKAYKGPKVSKVGKDVDYNAVSMLSNNYNDIKSKYCLTGLEFEKNSNKLLNPEKLNSIVSFIRSYNGSVDIFGTTAYDKTTSDERLQKLGYERALAVKNSLLERGVDQSKINRVASLSYKSLYHKEEWNEKGFNEQIAKLNRTVVFKDAQS